MGRELALSPGLRSTPNLYEKQDNEKINLRVEGRPARRPAVPRPGNLVLSRFQRSGRRLGWGLAGPR